MKSRILKIQTLIDHNACSEPVDLFRSTFGDSVIVTRARAIKYASVFSFEWAACLLSAPAWAAYRKVCAAEWAEYDKVVAAARAACRKVCAAAWAEYDKVRATARAEYLKVNAAAWAEYNKVNGAALAEYDKVRAAAWADAYIGDEK